MLRVGVSGMAMASKRRDEYKKRILRHKRHKHRVLPHHFNSWV